MSKVFNKILIIDGSYLLHRQLHLQSMYEMVSPTTGEPSGGIYGFLRSLNKEVLTKSQYFPIVVFDHGLAQRRTNADVNYKHSEDRADGTEIITVDTVKDDYITQYRKQRSALVTILSYFGIPSIMMTGWEGDDLIYIVSQMANESIILTDDKDMLQLLADNVNIRRPMANEKWDLQTFLQKRNYESIYDFVIYKALVGDESDNIPSSCKGIGEKTSNGLIKILSKFHNNGKWDLTGFPETDEIMKMVCTKLDVPYKKAYLNLDKNRFLTNIELVDLGLVTYDDTIINSIVSTVYSSTNSTNFFRLIKELSSYGINDVSSDTIIESVNIRRKYLMCE